MHLVVMHRERCAPSGPCIQLHSHGPPLSSLIPMSKPVPETEARACPSRQASAVVHPI